MLLKLFLNLAETSKNPSPKRYHVSYFSLLLLHSYHLKPDSNRKKERKKKKKGESIIADVIISSSENRFRQICKTLEKPAIQFSR